MKKSALICPVCHEREVKVLESRKKGKAVYRRRICEFCHHRFTTIERVVSDRLDKLLQDRDEKNARSKSQKQRDTSW